ncbi:hypothetical protein HDV01_004421 [Terramyces sp. JEL0728]|nr:hypothetical protein HDV01_004421 [Terramyces sp. JEL0728]
MEMFVSKNRRVQYECKLTIHELINLPYVSGQYFVKWKLSNSTTKGSTTRATVKDNKVVWEAEFTFHVNLYVEKNRTLSPCDLICTVKQEIYGGSSTDRLGNVNISLANVVGTTDPIMERYLLNDAKSNSLLLITTQMKQISGTTDFDM